MIGLHAHVFLPKENDLVCPSTAAIDLTFQMSRSQFSDVSYFSPWCVCVAVLFQWHEKNPTLFTLSYPGIAGYVDRPDSSSPVINDPLSDLIAVSVITSPWPHYHLSSKTSSVVMETASATGPHGIVWNRANNTQTYPSGQTYWSSYRTWPQLWLEKSMGHCPVHFV